MNTGTTQRAIAVDFISFSGIGAPDLVKKIRSASKFLSAFAALALLVPGKADAQPEKDPSPYEIIVSVAEQRLALIRQGMVLKTFPVSTSRFGIGDAFGSYKTPIGKLRVCTKLGDTLPEGAVIKKRNATGEVLRPNAPGRDPIVTRIIWLQGEEPWNRNARERCIYIHGTPEEKTIGRPASFGCIRMRSHDVVEIYGVVPVGTPVRILAEKLPKLPKQEILRQQQPVYSDEMTG